MLKQPFYFLCFILFFLSAKGIAQLYYQGRTLTVANGLSDNRITCFYKDVTGFIWIGTKNGLNRYDGHSFKIFKPTTGNSISNEVINAVTGDKEGNIWVATMSGLNRLHPATGRWTHWLPQSISAGNDLPNELVWDLAVDEDGLIWIASDVFQFSSLNPVTNTFTYYNWPEFVTTIKGKRTPPGYHTIQRLLQKNKEEFWLGTNKGLVHLNTKTSVFTFLGGGYNGIVTDMKWNANTQQVVLSIQNNKVFSYSERTHSFREEQPVPDPYPSQFYPVTESNPFLIASDKGLLLLSNDRWRLSQHIPELTASLPPGGVTTVYIDDTGLQWIGTPNGIYLLDYKQVQTCFLPLLPASDKEGTNRMSGVWYSQQDSLYFVCALNPSALFLIHRSTGRIKKITADSKGVPLPACNTVRETGGQLWLLTANHCYQFDRSTQTLLRYSTPFDGADAGFRDITMDAEKNLWFASLKQGLFYKEAATGLFRRIKKENNDFSLPMTTSLHTDLKQNKLWIASFGYTLFEYDLQTKQLLAYQEKEQQKKYSFLSLVNQVSPDKEGRFWIATNAGGLFRYNPGTTYDSAFTQFDMKRGLHQNQFFSVVAGKTNTLWLLSGKGVSAFNTVTEKETAIPQPISFSNYGSDPNHPHELYYQEEADEVVVPAGGGLLFYAPSVENKIPAFQILLTGIYTRREGAAPEEQSIEPVIRFSHKQQELRLLFSGLYYGSGKITYEYHMNGYDTTWQAANNEMEATYQNLPAKTYTFQVRAIDHNGTVIGQSSETRITIVPPFWQRWWFFAALLLLAAGFLYQLIDTLQQRVRDEKLLNQFATSLFGKSSVDEIFWQVAHSCIRLLDFEDCVVYLYDPQRKVLVQRAAAGPKSPYANREIINHLELPVGKGIVGTVAQTGKAERVGNTSKDPRYIVDDERRYAEITVPIWVDGALFGIIDSEHSRKFFFKKRHLRLLQRIAAVCGERISKYLTEDRLRTKIARDLHDEMGSTLTSINILSKVAMAPGKHQEEVQSYIQKIKEHSGNMMESMSDIVWAINPSNDTIDKVLLRMKEFAAEMLEPSRINYYFETNNVSDTLQLNLEQRKDLYLIYKEALNNAVKYSGATELMITLQSDHDFFEMRITDNGTGFDPKQVSSGNGLKNMHSRAAAIGATLTIESIKGSGSTILLKKRIT